MRKWIWGSLFAGFLAAVAVFGVAFGIAQTYKTLTGLGNVDFVDEVQVTTIQVQSASRIRVRLTSIASTQPAITYTVTLFLDGEPSGSETVSWTAPQIPGTTKNVDFTGLTLGSVTSYGVEVTR